MTNATTQDIASQLLTDRKLSHLKSLEAESIYILREAVAEFAHPVMLYSIGKDSSVLLHLALKAFAPGKPHLWSDHQLYDLDGTLNYDLAPDGKRFAIFPELKAQAEEKGDVHMTFLLNFFDELRRRVPTGR